MADKITAEDALKLHYSDSVTVEKIVSAPVPVAFTKFHEYVWLKNAGVGPESWTTIVSPGDATTLEGETRKAAGLVKEKILRTIPNDEIMYTVVAGPFPVNNHLGVVKFYAEGADKTRVVWTAKFTPKLGMGLAVKGVIKSAFSVFLYKFEKVIHNMQAPSASSGGPEMATPAEAADAEAQTFTDSTVVERILSGPVPVVFQQFREVVWLKNAGVGPASWTYILDEGDKETHVGEVRKAGGVVEEKILRVVENEMIVYTVVKGPMPVHNHLGSVLFTPEAENKTKITWSVKYTPMTGAGVAVKTLINNIFGVFLDRLEQDLTKSASS